jgi:hypothetical protein
MWLWLIKKILCNLFLKLVALEELKTILKILKMWNANMKFGLEYLSIKYRSAGLQFRYQFSFNRLPKVSPGLGTAQPQLVTIIGLSKRQALPSGVTGRPWPILMAFPPSFFFLPNWVYMRF